MSLHDAEACPHCATPRQEGDAYCGACGYRFGVVPNAAAAGTDAVTADVPSSGPVHHCPACGAPATIDGGFCAQCGHALTGQVTPAPAPAASGSTPAPAAASAKASAVRDGAKPAFRPTAGGRPRARRHLSASTRRKLAAAGGAIVLLAATTLGVAGYRQLMTNWPIANADAHFTPLVGPDPEAPAVPAATKHALNNAKRAGKPAAHRVAAKARTDAHARTAAARPRDRGRPDPPRAAPLRSNADIAADLMAKADAALARQDYGSAIANANAALAVRPGYAPAERVLAQAQTAQRHAMARISIH